VASPRRLFVVVSGPPASGTSTLAPALAAELGLPLVAKDTIKDALMSVLPVPDVDTSRQLVEPPWPDELWNAEVPEPVAGGWPILEVDTTGPTDMPQLARQICELLGQPNVNT
jgi:hypothetical protein